MRAFAAASTPSHHAPLLYLFAYPRHRIGLDIEIRMRLGLHGQRFFLGPWINAHRYVLCDAICTV